MDFDESERKEFRLLPGDLLICEGGEVGRTAIWRGEVEECYFQKAIHRARPRDERTNPAFIMYHLMNAFLIRNAYGVVGTDTTIAHLPGVKLKALLMPAPPRVEQDTIVEALQAVDIKMDAEESQLKAIDDLFQSLLHQLMTGRVRVKGCD
jgi:type I restriction enzyme, S subunit